MKKTKHSVHIGLKKDTEHSLIHKKHSVAQAVENNPKLFGRNHTVPYYMVWPYSTIGHTIPYVTAITSALSWAKCTAITSNHSLRPFMGLLFKWGKYKFVLKSQTLPTGSKNAMMRNSWPVIEASFAEDRQLENVDWLRSIFSEKDFWLLRFPY